MLLRNTNTEYLNIELTIPWRKICGCFRCPPPLLFRYSPCDPALAAAWLMVFAFAFPSGLVVGCLGRRLSLVCGRALTLVISLGAAISMIARPGTSELWTQTAALMLFAPAPQAGASKTREKRARRKGPPSLQCANSPAFPQRSTRSNLLNARRLRGEDTEIAPVL